MIIFTNEIFLNVKHIYSLNIGAQHTGRGFFWFVHFSGFMDKASPGYEHLDQTITCASKKDAYKLYKDIMKQIIDSGEVVELNNKSFDEILSKGEVK